MGKTVKKQTSKKTKRVCGYLVIELIAGRPYAYIESPRHHKKMMLHRHPDLRQPMSALHEECDLLTYGQNVYFVQELR